MHRKLASYFVVLAVGMAMGLGAVAVAQTQTPPPVQAKSAALSAGDRQIIRQLKDLNSKLGFNFRSNSLVGLTFDGFNDLHRDLVESCNALNRSISGSSLGCPSFSRP